MLIAVKHDIQSNRRFDLERDQIETVAVELLKDSYKPVILYIFYHADPGPDDLNLLNYYLQQHTETPINQMVIGRVYLNQLRWNSSRGSFLCANEG